MLPQQIALVRYVKVNSSQQLEAYKVRQSCSHPAIPSIRIVARKQNLLCIQVRLFEKKLVDYMKVLHNELITLQLLQEVVTAAIYIRSKFGCFAVSENLIKIDGQGIPKLWIHQDPISIIRQIPLPNQKSGQRAMIKSILVIFKPFIRRYQNLIKLDTFQELKNQLKKIINSYKTERDTDRKLTMTASKALLFLKNSKNHNVAAGTQRQNNTYSNHNTFINSPRFSSTQKNQDNKRHQSTIIMKNQQNQSFISSRKNLFQIMQFPKTSKKQITQQNSYQIMINPNEQTSNQQFMSIMEQSIDNKFLKPYQSPNTKIHLNISRNTNLSNSILQDQINNLFGDEQHSQLEFDNNQIISQQIQKDFNFIFN